MNKVIKAKLDDVKIDFETPIVIGGKQVSQIIIREPLVRDIKIVSHIDDEIENNATLIANLTGYTPDEMLALPIHVFEALVSGLGSFQSSKEMKS